jgi:amino acid adenylation domain-containing protein/thioester reductase-like protein
MPRRRVRRHARADPHRVAVVAGPHRLTYQELDRAAGRLTGLLRRGGVGPGALVALYLPRTVDVVVGLLGVLGSGAAYTIVEDDGNTRENVARLCGIGADLVLTTADHRDRLRANGLWCATVTEAVAGDGAVAEPAAGPGAVSVEPDGAAYVLFTSGSTGVPKGVMVTHANIEHYVESLLTRLDIGQPLTYAHVSTLSADLGNTCLFPPLWTGGTIHLVQDDVRKDPAALVAYLRDERIDVLKTTPSYWKAVFRAAGPGLRLRHLILGGELLTPELAASVLRSGVTRTLVNHYGPTETTVGVAVNVLTDPAQVAGGRSVPVGRPLGRTTFLVGTPDGGLRPTGMGELYVGGPSVAAGYRGDPAATRAAFVTVDGTRFYRTGDVVRVGHDGVTEFLGRTDRQVKIQGYRVELEHVEAVLRRLDGVADAAVFLRPNGAGTALVAAVAGPGSPDGLRAALGDLVPSYLVPARIVSIPGEFPRNANGKVDLATLARIVDAAQATGATGLGDVAPQGTDAGQISPQGTERPGEPDRFRHITEIWHRYVGPAGSGPDTDFFAAGGSSLDAIQLIADLQALGYRITARSFLATPTIRGLSAATNGGAGPAARDGAATVDGTAAGGAHRRGSRGGAPNGHFSAAQRAFFDRGFAEPDHWNQAILLRGQTVDAGALAAAVGDVVARHPLLRTAFHRTEDGWRAALADPVPDAFSQSSPDADGVLDDDRLAGYVQERARLAHAWVDLAAGRVFHVHLFARGGRPDLILLVGHHLCVDGVSWRILIDDLSQAYAARARRVEPGSVPASTSFWDWARHVDAHGPERAAAFAAWRAGTAPDPDPRPGTPVPATDLAARVPDGAQSVPDQGVTVGQNLERDAVVAWLALPAGETARLTASLATAGLSVHGALLGAFLQALALDDVTAVDVDVESHGRASFQDDVDVSRVVGWFTSTYPLAVTVVPGDVAGTVKAIGAALDTVPDLGIGHAFRRPDRSDPGPRICFNYLGRFEFGRRGGLELSHSSMPIGPARGGGNDRVHEFRLTARILADRLVIDLSFHRDRMSVAAATVLLRDSRALMLALAGLTPAGTIGAGAASADDIPVVVEHSSSAGLIAYAPRALRLDDRPSPPTVDVRRYQEVLLTGATGYLGAHLLRELLTRTGAHVHCLVRSAGGQAATDRLAAAYRWYFPAEPLERYPGRLTVYAGDAAAADLGLGVATYRTLAARLDAIYHLAADTRLFASAASLSRDNVDAVRAAVRLASTGRPKDLHYTSTLAVAGVNDRPVTFTEDDLDIGQEFDNPYERGKFLGEHVVRDFIAQGGAGFIYRTGNVTGDSRDGRFQRNAGANRFVQTMRAVIRTGRVPRDGRETVVLSPVDTVAAGIAAISLCPGVAGGTFHVEAGDPIEFSEIFDELRRLGYHLEASAARDIAGVLLEHPDPADPEVALGRLWASRRPRNVVVEQARTSRLLAGLGVRFEPPSRDWLRAHLRHLADGGHFGAAPGTLATGPENS